MQIEFHEPPQTLLEPVRVHLGLPRLWVKLSELGASQFENHRIDLRRTLIEFLTQKMRTREFGTISDLPRAMSELVALSDLSRVPRLTYARISISHCPEFGGFAIHPGNQGIGFDIELTSRVTPEIGARIGTAEEVANAPEPASLWVAKESAFKSLYGEEQPRTIGQIDLLEWRKIEDRVFGFRFEVLSASGQVVSGHGCVVTFRRLKLGFSVRQP